MAQLPHELEFVVRVPDSGTTSEHPDFDVYRPDGADTPLPAVVIVPGPSPAQYPFPPRKWPMYQGYGRLVASLGAIAVVLNLPYHGPQDCPALVEELPRVLESVRTLDEVDADRVALWAFSGGALLVGPWLAESPEWLRCLALTYPLLGTLDAGTPAEPADVVRPGRPLVLTRVGLELPDRQAVVDRFLDQAKATGTDVRVIDVPDGQHGFDVLDHTEQSRHAVTEATELVVGHLRR